jgi:hypothetical protein
VVALKRVKMENEHEGFPITSLREINMLLKVRHAAHARRADSLLCVLTPCWWLSVRAA